MQILCRVYINVAAVFMTELLQLQKDKVSCFRNFVWIRHICVLDYGVLLMKDYLAFFTFFPSKVRQVTLEQG